MKNDHIEVLSPYLYQKLRQLLSARGFADAEGTPWPTAKVEHQSARGHIQLRPVGLDSPFQSRPADVPALGDGTVVQVGDLSDITVDVLDALSALWLSQARGASDFASGSVDDLLALRGLKKKRSGQHRGGYEVEQRQSIVQGLIQVQQLWFNMDVQVWTTATDSAGRRKSRREIKKDVTSRAFSISDASRKKSSSSGPGHLDRFLFQPGVIFGLYLFGTFRQTALLSARALQYDPYRQQWEKRLTRYLSWIWRTRARDGDLAGGLKVSSLIENVGEELDEQRPATTKARLEKAINALENDKVLSAWQYQSEWDENIVGRRGWGRVWLSTTLLIEPPDVIKDQYRGLARHAQQPAAGTIGALGERVRCFRKERGWTQHFLADKVGMTVKALSALEDGRVPEREFNRIFRAKLEKLIASHSTPGPGTR